MQRKERLTVWQYVISILGAALGVQSQKVRERDFQHGKPWVYVVGGLTFTFIFISVLVLIVNAVVP